MMAYAFINDGPYQLGGPEVADDEETIGQPARNLGRREGLAAVWQHLGLPPLGGRGRGDCVLQLVADHGKQYWNPSGADDGPFSFYSEIPI